MKPAIWQRSRRDNKAAMAIKRMFLALDMNFFGKTNKQAKAETVLEKEDWKLFHTRINVQQILIEIKTHKRDKKKKKDWSILLQFFKKNIQSCFTHTYKCTTKNLWFWQVCRNLITDITVQAAFVVTKRLTYDGFTSAEKLSRQYTKQWRMQ